MDSKTIKRIALAEHEKNLKRKEPPIREPLSPRSNREIEDQSHASVNHIDDAMAAAIDNRATLKQHAKEIRKLYKTKDVASFFGDLAPQMALELLFIARSGESEKSRLEALQDLLDRAGFGKVQKHAVANITPEQGKESLISMLLGAKKELAKSGIEIIDDENHDERTSTVLDRRPSSDGEGSTEA